MEEAKKRKMIAVIVSGLSFAGFMAGCEGRSSAHAVSVPAAEQSPRLTVEERVKRIIAEQLGVDMAKLTWHARFEEDLGADSLDAVELIMAFEEEFEIEISDDDAMKIKTVADAIEFLRSAAEK